MKELSKHTKAELIQIIRVYNDKNIIKNYHNLSKLDLIKLIEKHIQFDADGKVEAKQLPAKVIEYDAFKKTLDDKKLDKVLTDKQELKLARARGRQRGKIAKIDDQLDGLRDELENKPKLKDDKSFIKEVEDLQKAKLIERGKLKTINELFKKNEELQNKLKLEKKPKETKKKEEPKEQPKLDIKLNPEDKYSIKDSEIIKPEIINLKYKNIQFPKVEIIKGRKPKDDEDRYIFAAIDKTKAHHKSSIDTKKEESNLHIEFVKVYNDSRGQQYTEKNFILLWAYLKSINILKDIDNISLEYSASVPVIGT